MLNNIPLEITQKPGENHNEYIIYANDRHHHPNSLNCNFQTRSSDLMIKAFKNRK